MCRLQPPGPNLTTKEEVALRALLLVPSIRLAKADKGDCLVILDASHYLQLAYQYLDDPTTYECLSSDPTQHLADDLVALLRQLLAAGVIDQVMFEFLCLVTPTRMQ